MTRVAIAGVATVHGNEHDSLNDMIFEATSAALRDADLSRSEVDSVVLAAHDVADGRGITSMTTATAAGAYHRDEVRVAEDGLYAAALAHARVASGHYQTSLVVAWGKASESVPDIADRLGLEPFFERPAGLNEKVILALQANRYEHRFGAADADEVGRDYGEPIASPLRSGDYPLGGDAACAVIIKSSPASTHPEVWLDRLAWATDNQALGSRELSEMASLAAARRQLFEQGSDGVDLDDIVVCELQSLSKHFGWIVLEELGLSERGARGYQRGPTAGSMREPADLVRINPSGRRKNYGAASGLMNLVDVTASLRERNSGHGLAHGTSGVAGQAHCLALLSR